MPVSLAIAIRCIRMSEKGGLSLREVAFVTVLVVSRAELEGTNYMGQTGCRENLRFPPVFCENLCFQNAVIPRKAKISENLRKTANLAPFVPFSLSLLAPPSFDGFGGFGGCGGFGRYGSKNSAPNLDGNSSLLSLLCFPLHLRIPLPQGKKLVVNSHTAKTLVIASRMTCKQNTVGAEIIKIRELICSKAEVCSCIGNPFKLWEESVSAMRDFLPLASRNTLSKCYPIGVSHPISLLLCDNAQVSLRYPSCTGGGYCTSSSHARGRGVAPNLIGHVETPKPPCCVIRKVSLSEVPAFRKEEKVF